MRGEVDQTIDSLKVVWFEGVQGEREELEGECNRYARGASGASNSADAMSRLESLVKKVASNKTRGSGDEEAHRLLEWGLELGKTWMMRVSLGEDWGDVEFPVVPKTVPTDARICFSVVFRRGFVNHDGIRL